MIRAVTLSDSKPIAEIYNYYIETSAATFEEVPLSVSEMEERIRGLMREYPYFVYEGKEGILGYAYLHQYHARSAYRWTLEDSIYVRKGFHGHGIGKALFGKLLDEAHKLDIHAIIALITVPNERSVGLHESFGFKQAGVLSEVGKKFGKWQDVGYWELVPA